MLYDHLYSESLDLDAQRMRVVYAVGYTSRRGEATFRRVSSGHQVDELDVCQEHFSGLSLNLR